jgi:hypothetical protein
MPVLRHANNEGIDHLESATMGTGESVYMRRHRRPGRQRTKPL